MTRYEEILELFQFNAWATRRMFEATAALTEEELSRDLGSSFPSVRDTLVHIVGAEWVWLTRWLGTSPTALPGDKSTLTHQQVVDWWQGIDAERATLLRSLGQDGIDTVVHYTNFAGTALAFPLWQQLRHLVNHSTYHRGQVTTMLRQLGHPAPATDMILMYQETLVAR